MSAWPQGRGEMAARIREADWAASPLGPIENWPQSLKTALDLVLAMPGPATLLWGPVHVQFYNDAYLTIAQDRHPALLGRPVAEGWPDAYEAVILPVLEAARLGRSTRLIRQCVPLLGADGQIKERYFDTDISPVPDESGAVAGALLFSVEITEREQAQRSLRESEQRQAFLLDLSDTLRPLTRAREIKAAACALLGETLGASRVYFVEMDEAKRTGFVQEDYTADGVASVEGRYDFDLFPASYARLRTGAAWVVPDLAAETALPASERAAIGSAAVIAWIDVSLLKDGQVEAVLCVTQTEPRAWTSSEVHLVEETAERLWSAVRRGRVEVALRASEERFRQFAQASAAGLWIRSADTLDMEYVSPAVSTIYGVEPAALLGDVQRWAALIVPEDRDGAVRHMERALRGEAAVNEFRIRRPSDQAFRWVRNIDFPLLDHDGAVERIGGIADDVTEARLAVEHQGVLLAELQHRVRNIMGVIRSMANRTASGASGVEDYRSRLDGRLLALARTQALLTRRASVGGSLKAIIESEVAAQAHHGGQYALSGPDVTLAPKAVEVLTLAFHELSTNALKYGALSTPEGRLRVTWTLGETRGMPWLSLDWIEEGAPPRAPATRRGFGSELIEARIPYELGGRGRIAVGADGARCHLEFPVRGGQSILQTDAPQPATVSGGALDMTTAPDLTGRTVLVVEDDYYLAHDTAAALRGAGADVLGPCPSEAATLALLEDEMPTHAVLDLNLGGGGPRFEIAYRLKGRSIPFVFLTGYDLDQIPEDMRNVVRLEKPLPFRTVVEAVSQL